MYVDLTAASAAEHRRHLLATASRSRLAALARCCSPSRLKQAAARLVAPSVSPCAC